MASRPEALFTKATIGSALDFQRKQMHNAIEGMGRDRVLNADPEKLAAAIADKYRVDIPVIGDKETISVDTRDATMRQRDPWGDNPQLKGTEFEFHVPYEGDTECFQLTPSSWSRHPRAIVTDHMLALTYFESPGLGMDAQREFEADLAAIRSYMDSMRKEADPFNESLIGVARQAIDARRRKLLGDDERAAKFGYALRRRSNASGSYVVPAVRKRPRIAMPTQGQGPFVREPVLEMAEYEETLDIIGNVGVAMERSPSIFGPKLDEEGLRFHFVIALNGAYEGAATGEAFNLGGETDILIRYNDRNVFIAECKFWTGQKGLTQAIDQLLEYLCWRDTKTAIVLFNRGLNMSTVLEKVPVTVKQHPNFLGAEQYGREGAFRFRLQMPDDRERELLLTVMAFAVPA